MSGGWVTGKPATAGARNIPATSVAENRLDADLLVSGRATTVRPAPTAELLPLREYWLARTKNQPAIRRGIAG
jgi:hypothetical protein